MTTGAVNSVRGLAKPCGYRIRPPGKRCRVTAHSLRAKSRSDGPRKPYDIPGPDPNRQRVIFVSPRWRASTPEHLMSHGSVTCLSNQRRQCRLSGAVLANCDNKGRPMSVEVSNLFLSCLSAESRVSLISRSLAVELPVHTVLYEAGSDPRHAYFLTSGLASVVTPMSNGEVAEVGFIGHEGVVGSLQLLGSAIISTRCMMQLAGSGLKIPFASLQRAFEESGGRYENASWSSYRNKL